MIKVVPGEHVGDAVDGLHAAFRVNSVVLPLLGRQGLEQSQISFAERAELLDRLTRVAFVIVSAAHPTILVEAGDGRARGSKDQAHAKAANNLAVGQVCENFAH